MTYKIKEFELNHKVVLEGHGKSFSALDTIQFIQGEINGKGMPI
jgi:hypothetical protein